MEKREETTYFGDEDEDGDDKQVIGVDGTGETGAVVIVGLTGRTGETGETGETSETDGAVADVGVTWSNPSVRRQAAAWAGSGTLSRA